MALLCRACEPHERLAFILGDALAGSIHLRKLILRLLVAGLCSQAIPLESLGVVLLNAASGSV